MKENNLTEEEKSMYGVSFITLVACTFLLVFVGFNSAGNITGNVVLDAEDNEELSATTNETPEEVITQEQALSAILQAEADMVEIKEAGFGISWFNDTLIETKKYFEGEDYTALLEDIERINDTEKRENAKSLLLAAQEKIGVDVNYKKVLEITKTISERKQRTYEISDLIRASEIRILEFKEQNVDTFEAEEMLSTAINEFENERFESIEEILNNVDAKLIDLSAETTIVRTIYRAGKENIVDFVKEHLMALLLLLGSLLVIAILLYNRIRIAILRRNIKDMKVEKDILDELMKKAQSDYFTKGDITKQTFEIKMSKFKERLVEIKQKLPVTETLLDKRLKSKRVL
tara:strand:- start:9340 stop:10380 length:1041 start_codon:yes stop_codon:yes gene_type:complete